MITKELEQKIEAYIAKNRQNVVEDLKTLVRFPSVSRAGEDGKPFGKDCADVLAKALEMAAAKGLTATNHNDYYGIATYGEGDKTIGMFSHLDVVPVSDNWIHKPYDPQEQDGFLFGRGVCDNKNAAVVSMYVFQAFRELGLPLHSKLSLYFGCSEETGMEDIEAYVREQPMPDFSIVPDTSFPVCHGEKGILSAVALAPRPWSQLTSFSGGIVGNMVADSAVATLPMDTALLVELRLWAEKNPRITVVGGEGEITVTATGEAAHASRPQGAVNAIHELAEFLSGVPALAAADRELLTFAAQVTGGCYGEALGIQFQDAPSGKLTCISGVAKTQEGRLALHFNVRYPVTDHGDRVSRGIGSALSAAGWELSSFHDSAPSYLPADDPKVQELCRIYHEVTGKDSTPYVMGGGTYARDLRNAIGFGMESEILPQGLPSGHGGIHQPDEAVFIQDLLSAMKIYILSILEIDQLLHR